MNKIRVVVAESDALFRKSLCKALNRAGLQVVSETDDGKLALNLVRGMQPDLLLAGLDLPAVPGTELAGIVHAERLAAVILIADRFDHAVIQSEAAELIPVLVKPFEEVHLLSLMSYSLYIFKKMVTLEQELCRLQSGLEVRKTVEKAKGILMKVHDLSEEEAFRKIQQQSMKKRTTMKNVAEAIIMAFDVSSG